MLKQLLPFLFLVGQILANETPDVECLVIHLEHVRCVWNLQGTPDVNYTFSSRFSGEGESSCADYLTESGTNIGCRRPYTTAQRFNTFYTKLTHGTQMYLKELDLKGKVKLNPPTNVTVKNGSDFNLWFYWNQTKPNCVESQVRVRMNNNKWEPSSVYNAQHYCLNLPSSSARYELQVRSRIESSCGESEFWSDWSEPAVWGSNNTTYVECLVIHLEHVRCVWNLQGTPDVNYTFSSRFSGERESSCADYLTESGTNIGCRRPYTTAQRFKTFYTKLTHGTQMYLKELDLKGKVKLNPPTNVTVKNGSDFNLWFYWNQTKPNCVESQVRVRMNNNKWEPSSVYNAQHYCLNLPSSSARYELQVRSRIESSCGESEFWSDWSEPAVWGSNNTTWPDFISPNA